MFTPEIELGEPKYRVLCKFSVKSTIYNVQLPGIVKNRLVTINIMPDSSKLYLIDVSFSIDTYQCKDFYKFSVEHRQKCLGKAVQRSGQEKVEVHINGVLSQQLKNICQEVSALGVRYRYATIAGEKFKNVQRVVFHIYEDAATTALEAEQTDGRKKFNPTVYTILPHRALIIDKLAKQVSNSFVV